MKVILLQDVKTLGKKGDIVEVNQGYARNFVLPRKLGVEATPQNLNDLKLKNQNDAKVAAEQLAEAKALAERLEKASVTASIKVGEGGRAFGSISSKEIADLVKKQLSLTIDKKKIVVKEPIKGLGTSRVTVKLHPEVSAELTVNVVEDKK